MAVTTHKAPPKALGQPTRKEQLAPHVEMTLKGHREEVNEVAFILGTRLLVTGSGDESLRVWDLDTGKQVGEPLLGHDAAVWRIAASPNGGWVVSGGTDGSILVWEVAPNKREFKRVPIPFKGHGRSVWGVVFAPDSETFASASSDETVCVWKRETGEIVYGPLNVGSRAFSVVYSPDGKKLATGTSKHIIVWNTQTRKESLKIDQRAYRVAFTPDGLRLVSGNYYDIRISDATTGDIIKQFDAHTTDTFYGLAIAPDGTKLATTSSDKTTRFFDLTTFKPIGEPLEHPDQVRGLAFSKDSQFIATGCGDKLIRIWTVPLSETELQQSTEKVLEETIPGIQPRPRRVPIQTSRFFDGFDPHGHNNRAATATRNTDGFKNMMNRLFSRSSTPQDHNPRPRSTPLTDVFATRGKHRTANRHTAARDKLLKQQRPPRNWHPAHAGASTSSASPAGTSNVTDGIVPAALQTGGAGASATATHPSLSDCEHVPDISCFAVITRCFPRLSRTRPTSSAAPRTG